METFNKYHNNYTFTGRCIQIKDAQWVCHTINSNLPHFSPSKFKPAFTELYFKEFPEMKALFYPKTIHQLNLLLDCVNLTKEDYNQLDLFGKLKFNLKRIFRSKESKKNLEILAKSKELIRSVGKYRKKYKNMSMSLLAKTLMMLEQNKIGNCLEDAILAELICKMNGIHNATLATLLNGSLEKQLDHSVCVFNKDGSKFSGLITNNTIIIDPWTEKADFAKNMIPFYKNTMTESFNVNSDTNITLYPVETIFLTEKEMKFLKEKYKCFIYPNFKRKFMNS